MRSLAFISLLLLLHGCTTKQNPAYCDDAKICDGEQYCDTGGIFGPRNQCVSLGSACTPGLADQCTDDVTAPICDVTVSRCRPCQMTDSCPGGGVCDEASGECVPATCSVEQNDCPFDAPTCDEQSGTCMVCDPAGDGDIVCAGHADWPEPLPYCVAGQCAECADTSHCIADGQVCDPNSHTCEACTEHAQCPTGACDINAGTCLDDMDILHVDMNNGAASDAGTCTVGIPCLSIGRALEVVDNADPRSVVVVHGDAATTYPLFYPIQNFAVTIIGQGAKIAYDPAQTPQDGPIITVTGAGADVTIEGLTITGAGRADAGAGISCGTGASVRLRRVEIADNKGIGVQSLNCALVVVERSMIRDNLQGGLYLVDTGFELTNNVIAVNGNNVDSDIGGLGLVNPFAKSPQVFDFNTVAQNTAKLGASASGLWCTVITDMTGTGNIVQQSFNVAPVSLTRCAMTYSNIQDGDTMNGNITDPPTFVDTGARDYHLMPGSAGVDIDGWAPTPCAANDCIDYDGDARPQDGAYDMGADEVVTAN